MQSERVPTVRRVAQTKSLARLDGYLSRGQILARRAGFRSVLLQWSFPPSQRPRVQLDNLVRLFASGLKLVVFLHHGQRHAHLFGHDSDGFRERDALHLHHEVEDGASLVTSEAVENIFGWIDRKRWRLLLMKRAASHPVRALLLERHVILDDAHDVRLSA